jgi:hypothetical protein
MFYGIKLDFEFFFNRKSRGPRPNHSLRVHGGPRAGVAEGLAGARARGRSGEWKLADGGGKGKGSLGGSYRG